MIGYDVRKASPRPFFTGSCSALYRIMLRAIGARRAEPPWQRLWTAARGALAPAATVLARRRARPPASGARLSGGRGRVGRCPPERNPVRRAGQDAAGGIVHAG